MSYRSIVLSGGGTRGIAQLGAIHALNKKGKIDNVGSYYGTSAGSIFALLLLIGYSATDILEIVSSFDFEKLMNFDFGNLIGGFGLDDGTKIVDAIKVILHHKLDVEDVSFQELYEITGKNLTVAATHVENGNAVYFNRQFTPDHSVIRAIRKSFSIPYLFTPVIEEDGTYVDGAFTNNYPIDQVDDVTEAVGIFVKNESTIGKINDLEEYTMALFNMSVQKMTRAQANLHQDQTIFIEFDGEALVNYKLTNEEKRNMFNIGYEAGISFLHANKEKLKRKLKETLEKRLQLIKKIKPVSLELISDDEEEN